MLWAVKLALVTLFLLLLQKTLYRRFAFSKIEYSRSISADSAFIGDEIQMVEEISNRKLLPLPGLIVESRIADNLYMKPHSAVHVSDRQYYRSVYSLMPFCKITRRYTLVCSCRGYKKFDTVTVTQGDLFNIGDSSYREFESPNHILVYPRPAELAEMNIPRSKWMGDMVVRRWIIDDPYMVAGVRDYQNGDPMKSINWKATARVGMLQVHKRDYTSNSNLLIFLNIQEREDQVGNPSEEGKELLECAISCCAAAAQYAFENGMSVAFATNGTDSEGNIVEASVPSSRKNHLFAILEALAKVGFDWKIRFVEFLENSIGENFRDTDILVVTLYASEELIEEAERIRLLGNKLELLIVDREVLALDKAIREKEGSIL